MAATHITVQFIDTLGNHTLIADSVNAALTVARAVFATGTVTYAAVWETQYRGGRTTTPVRTTLLQEWRK